MTTFDVLFVGSIMLAVASGISLAALHITGTRDRYNFPPFVWSLALALLSTVTLFLSRFV